jgi:hypothetical protein
MQWSESRQSIDGDVGEAGIDLAELVASKDTRGVLQACDG